jgi:16S rRNA (uracil1498-N3)-methyltransferase
MHPADHPGPLAFVDDLDTPVLSADDRHHLERVLRLRAGAPLTLADGQGRWRTGVFGADVVATGSIEEEPLGDPPITIAFALVKGDKPELIVQKLTELGIDRIVPFRAERSVVRWDAAKAAKVVVRLRAVARSAAMQCHRPLLPVIADVADLRSLAREPGAVLADRGGAPPSLDHPVVLVGPEGGWAPGERSLVAPSMAVGHHVLRAETAAVTAGALMTALRAGLVAPR